MPETDVDIKNISDVANIQIENWSDIEAKLKSLYDTIHSYKAPQVELPYIAAKHLANPF